MKMQVCRYRDKPLGEWKDGVAIVESFGVSDISGIISATTGITVMNVEDYRLVEGALCYLDTHYDRGQHEV